MLSSNSTSLHCTDPFGLIVVKVSTEHLADNCFEAAIVGSVTTIAAIINTGPFYLRWSCPRTKPPIIKLNGLTNIEPSF